MANEHAARLLKSAVFFSSEGWSDHGDVCRNAAAAIIAMEQKMEWMVKSWAKSEGCGDLATFRDEIDTDFTADTAQGKS